MLGQKIYEWFKIAETEEELLAQPITEIEVADKKLCLTKHDNQLLACQAICPHAGVPLKDGYVDAKGNIVCPLHHYKFSLKTGRNVRGEGYLMRTYPIEHRADGIYLGIEKK